MISFIVALYLIRNIFCARRLNVTTNPLVGHSLLFTFFTNAARNQRDRSGDRAKCPESVSIGARGAPKRIKI